MAFLLAAVVGSGIMGERLSNGNAGLALLSNSVATGAALAALILAFGATHLNPAVTLTEAWRGAFPWREVPAYVGAQIAGAFAGVAAAHLMFGLPVFAPFQHARSGFGQLLSEFIASFGLLLIIRRATRGQAAAVACYIAAAYWFTASTSFANPAVTLARAVTDTFTGIRPLDSLRFVLAQLLGTGVAALFLRWLDSGDV
jgi:glycerol uptake facilitator-like aquaporin